MWRIDETKIFQSWRTDLSIETRQELVSVLYLLRRFGPRLGRPYADTVYGSKYRNMKELRFRVRKIRYRIFYVFNSRRTAVLVSGGVKNNKPNFYRSMIKKADRIYSQYLDENGAENGL